MYKVIKAFHDLNDSKLTKAGTIFHFYDVDDTYPRQGLKPSEERIEELSGSNNAQGQPLIIRKEAAGATDQDNDQDNKEGAEN